MGSSYDGERSRLAAEAVRVLGLRDSSIVVGSQPLTLQATVRGDAVTVRVHADSITAGNDPTVTIEEAKLVRIGVVELYDTQHFDGCRMEIWEAHTTPPVVAVEELAYTASAMHRQWVPTLNAETDAVGLMIDNITAHVATSVLSGALSSDVARALNVLAQQLVTANNEAVGVRALGFCHGSINENSIATNGGGIVFVGFEHAHTGNVCFDIASICAVLTRQAGSVDEAVCRRERFLERYATSFGNMPGPSGAIVALEALCALGHVAANCAHGTLDDAAARAAVAAVAAGDMFSAAGK